MRLQNKIAVLLCVLCLSFTKPSFAQNIPPSKNLINGKVITMIKDFVDTEIVRLSIENQNAKYGKMSESEIIALDKQWRAETKNAVQPLISATLSNPLSSYLTRVQARSIGLYSEMFAMDATA